MSTLPSQNLNLSFNLFVDQKISPKKDNSIEKTTIRLIDEKMRVCVII